MRKMLLPPRTDPAKAELPTHLRLGQQDGLEWKVAEKFSHSWLPLSDRW